MRYQITSLYRDEGTIVLFRCQRLSTARNAPGDRLRNGFGRTRLVAVDHRPARDIAEALRSGIRPIVEPESWQVMG